MAYAYGALDDLMGQNQQQKQNIFAAQPGGSPSAAGEPGAGGVEGSAGEKTSTEGEIGGGGTGASKSAATSAPTVSDSGTAAAKTQQAAYKANVGKVKAPSTLQNIQTRLGEAETGLAQQAQDYATQQAQSHNYALDRAVAEKAVKEQDSQAKSDVLALRGRELADPIDYFKPTNIDVADVDLLRNPAGIKQLVSRGRKPTYGANMAAFDAMLLQADPNFQRQVAGIKGQAGDLQRNVAQTTEQSQAAAEAAAQSNLAASKKDIDDYLLGYKGNILSEEEAAAAAANASLPQEIEALKGKVGSDLLKGSTDTAQANLRQMFGGGRADPQLQQALAGLDPAQYIDFIKSYTPEQFVTKDQATQFNTINQLMGLGGTPQVAGERPELYSTRNKELTDLIFGKALKGRQEADIAGQKQIDDLIAAAGKRAAAENARRMGLVGNLPTEMQNYANKLFKTSEFTGAGYDPKMNAALADYVGRYANENPVNNPQLSALDVLSQGDVSQLGALNKDLGLGSTYNVGQYAGGGPALYDPNRFKSSLLSELGRLKAMPGKPRIDASGGPEGIIASGPFQF